MSRHERGPNRAKRSLGQNFLSDPNYIRKIVDAVDASANDVIVEIGPGRGALTGQLLNTGAIVVAVELDRDLIGPLTSQFADRSNFDLVEADALDVDFGDLISRSRRPTDASLIVKLAANLPYYISTAILQRLSEQRSHFQSMVLMFQKEVVERIVAEPGNSERGYLTVLVERAFIVERLFDVPSQAFRPAPKVTSSVVRLIPKSGPEIGLNSFRRLVSAGFAQKRKTLLNNLKNAISDVPAILERSGIDGGRRAESLTLEEWLSLHSNVLRLHPADFRPGGEDKRKDDREKDSSRDDPE